MSYQISYSPAARRDLDRIEAEVLSASRDWDTAVKYISDLMDLISSYCECPLSASPLYFENGFTGYYYLVFKAYLIFFRVRENRLLVERILYGKSDYMRSLFGG